MTGKETRSLVLGHLQRGGMPTGYDRLLATRFGGAAVRAVAEEKWGHMVALQSPHIVTIPIEEALREPKRVDPDARRRADGARDGDQLRGLTSERRTTGMRQRSVERAGFWRPLRPTGTPHSCGTDTGAAKYVYSVSCKWLKSLVFRAGDRIAAAGTGRCLSTGVVARRPGGRWRIDEALSQFG